MARCATTELPRSGLSKLHLRPRFVRIGNGFICPAPTEEGGWVASSANDIEAEVTETASENASVLWARTAMMGGGRHTRPALVRAGPAGHPVTWRALWVYDGTEPPHSIQSRNSIPCKQHSKHPPEQRNGGSPKCSELGHMAALNKPGLRTF